MHAPLRISIACLSLALLAPSLPAGDWLHWRGPTGNGVAPDAKPPVSWSATENIAWKAEIPGSGSASPIVVGDQVIVVTAVAVESEAKAGEAAEPGAGARAENAAPQQDSPRERGGRRRGGRGGGGEEIQSQKFLVLSFDRQSGKKRWEAIAAETKPHQGHHRDHGFASASPCSDGKRIFAHFGSRGIFAYSLDGKPLWQRTDLGRMDTRMGFGEGSSPTVAEGLVIVPWDHQGPSYLLALDAETGKTKWKVERPDEPSCWATPLVVEHAGKRQVIVSGEGHARGYDLASGEELWRCSGQTARPVASPVAGHGLAFVGSGYQGAYLGAFDLSARGDLRTNGGVKWSIDRNTPDVPSLLLSGSRLYFQAKRDNILSCLDAETGTPHYSASRVEGLGSTYASPVAANGHVYLTGRDGTTVVIEDAPELKIVAKNSVGEPVDATPAPAGDTLFIRGAKHLFAIRK